MTPAPTGPLTAAERLEDLARRADALLEAIATIWGHL